MDRQSPPRFGGKKSAIEIDSSIWREEIDNRDINHIYLIRHCPQAEFFLDFFFLVDFFVPGTTTTSAGRKEEYVKFWVL
jgi:hypothetical protein